MSGNTLLVVDTPFGVLALDAATIEAARARAAAVLPGASPEPQSSQPDDRIVTAEQAAEITSVPATWFTEQMRRGTLPHLVFGKYRRMRLADVLRAAEARPSYTASTAVGVPRTPKNQCIPRTVTERSPTARA